MKKIENLKKVSIESDFDLLDSALDFEYDRENAEREAIAELTKIASFNDFTEAEQ